MSILMGILHQLCPRCGVGRIFRGSLLRGFPRMNERCPVCDLKFAREEGYFLGAMDISYGISVVVICLFAAVVWMLTRCRCRKLCFRACSCSSLRARHSAVLASAVDLPGSCRRSRKGQLAKHPPPKVCRLWPGEPRQVKGHDF